MANQPFPSVSAVAAELRAINANVECDEDGCEVRLRVRQGEPLAWAVLYGDPGYDTDHNGYWGASFVPGVVKGVVRRFPSRDVARDLLEQAKDQAGRLFPYYLAGGRLLWAPDIDVRADLAKGDELHACCGFGWVLAVVRAGEGIGFVCSDEVGYESAKDFCRRFGSFARFDGIQVVPAVGEVQS